MSVYFYLTTNINKNEPEALASIAYIHVKAKGDGSQTAIITETLVVDEAVVEMSQSELQAILDSWIAEENQNPEIDTYIDPETEEVIEQPRLQRVINLGVYLA